MGQAHSGQPANYSSANSYVVLDIKNLKCAGSEKEFHLFSNTFQDTSTNSPTVLLLSLRAGGVGLNLNVANHLLLLDPAWNPSTEDQCFDRIHRLGQTKEVEITRYVMKNS